MPKTMITQRGIYENLKVFGHEVGISERGEAKCLQNFSSVKRKTQKEPNSAAKRRRQS